MTQRQLLSGNEAIARGAYEAGVTVAAGYPGTPSTEILEAIRAYKESIYCEWSPNEKVAFEVAAGASVAGARSIVTMKHVGLNVAADPLMTLAYLGVEGGFVACVADDPGMHSSQNEQDTRHFARFAKVPLLEPADSQECKDFLRVGLELSEAHKTPVILRTTTRVSHSHSLVTLGERIPGPKAVQFEKEPSRWVAIPMWARKMRVRVEERLGELTAAAEKSPLNRIEWRDRRLGVVASGIAYQYVREAFPEASVLKLGWSVPFPNALLREFAAGVDQVFVVEEQEDIVEQHMRSLGIACVGRRYVPGVGELSTTRVLEARAKFEGRDYQTPAPKSCVDDLPARPPVLCAGCPHRGMYAALKKFDTVVVGDIGCYSLGTLPPLNNMDTLLCMGAGISMAHGMQKAGEPRKVVGIVGDSTFFHSGITGLLDIVYNRGKAVIIVVDNRTTAMTGHQEHPGTGRTLMGEPTRSASIEDFGRACGVPNIATIDPYNMKATTEVLRQAVESDEPWLIVSRAPCPLNERKRVGPGRTLNKILCRECGACLKLGCPALEGAGGVPTMNEMLCAGCGLCQQVCKFAAIQQTQGAAHE